MKTFRMMLPVVAVVFAIASAVGGDVLLPITQGYYHTVSGCSQTKADLNEDNCQINLPTNRPICTAAVAGSPAAFNDSDCSQPLRQQ